jgi:acetyl/propionyl-CoA carboxylase alpha subunit
LPKAETNLSSEISGKVVSVLVKEGSRVGAGQVVADQIEKNPMIVWQKKIKPSKTRVITQLLKNCLR